MVIDDLTGYLEECLSGLDLIATIQTVVIATAAAAADALINTWIS
jgi:hypothetical protein